MPRSCRRCGSTPGTWASSAIAATAPCWPSSPGRPASSAREAAAARKAVEGLKAWIARAAGVEWADHEDPMDAVIAAQVQKLGLGGVLDDAESRELQAYLAWRGGELPRAEKIWIMQLLGECIRKAAR